MVLVPNHLVTICPLSLSGREPKGCIGKRCMWFIVVQASTTGQEVHGGCAIPMLVPLVADLRAGLSGTTRDMVNNILRGMEKGGDGGER